MATIERYLPALARSTELLRIICLRLAAKAAREEPYTWRQYRNDVREYRASVEHYVRIGGDLNRVLAASGN
jgi:hypothetical protein